MSTIDQDSTRRAFLATGAATLGFMVVPRHVLGGPGDTFAFLDQHVPEPGPGAPAEPAVVSP